MSHPELNVALVGYGFAGRNIHAPLIASVPGLRLHTLVSRSQTRATIDESVPTAAIDADILRDLRIVADADTAFTDPAIDLVVIAAPTGAHAAITHAALARGKHVVVDKPFTVTLAEARDVTAAAARAGRLLSVFHNRRWDSDFLTMRRLVSDGTLGELVEWQSFADRYRPVVRDRWRERAEPGAGVWLDLGSHMVDQALQLCGPPRAVSADIGIQREGGLSDDYFHVVLRYDRLRVLLHGSSIAAAHTLRAIVHGTRASFTKDGWDPQEPWLRRGGRPGGPDWGIDPKPGQVTTVVDDVARTAIVASEAGDYRRYYAVMRDAIRGDAPVPVSPDEAIDVMAIMDLALRSAAERCELPFTPLAASGVARD